VYRFQVVSALCEIREKAKEANLAKKGDNMMRVISLFPLFSLFAIIQILAQYAAHNPGVIFNSQPTRCGHTLRGVHCRGWPRVSPLEPHKGRSNESSGELGSRYFFSFKAVR
jgi:hypothetical protein